MTFKLTNQNISISLVTAMGLLCWSSSASANPKPLPFSYGYQTLGTGDFEIEQTVDMVPVRVMPELGSQSVVSMRYDWQTEFELGLTDRLEASFYLVFEQGADASSPSLGMRGIKQRLRYRFADEGKWPVDVGVYGEVAEFHDELELEEKLLLSKRLGPLTLVSNLWIEQEYEYQTKEAELVYNPTLGAHYQLSPKAIVGMEYWARGEIELEEEEEEEAMPGGASGAHHYLGPTFLAQTGEVFLSVGVYARLDALGERVAVDDSFGKVWVRALVGMGF